MKSDNPGDADSVWDREITIVRLDDNDGTNVSILDVLGSGILIAFGYDNSDSQQTVGTTITIDGVVEENAQVLSRDLGAIPVSATFPIFRKYSVSCLVKLFLSGAGTANYWGILIAD